MIGASSLAGAPLGGGLALAAGVTAVISDGSAAYVILAKVSADGSAAYALQAAVSSSASASYSILTIGAVSSDGSASYSIRAAVSADGVASYAISTGSLPTAEQFAAAVLAAMNAAPPNVNLVQVKGQAVAGSGSEADPWGP